MSAVSFPCGRWRQEPARETLQLADPWPGPEESEPEAAHSAGSKGGLSKTSTLQFSDPIFLTCASGKGPQGQELSSAFSFLTHLSTQEQSGELALPAGMMFVFLVLFLPLALCHDFCRVFLFGIKESDL